MTPSISQILSSSYPAVVANKKRPENQWAESSFMRALQSLGMIVSKNLGPTIEAPFDWRRNTTAAVLGATELTAGTLTTKTDVISTASYVVAQVRELVIWSKGDDAKNPEENQKVDLVASLLDNAIQSHDDLLEATLFVTSSAGGDELIGLDNMVSSDGLGTIGGVVSNTDTFWRSKVDGYTNGDDLEAGLESLWVRCEKGTGSPLRPKLLVSDGGTQALFASTQQAQQRYIDSQELKASFKSIAFKTAMWVYSQYGTPDVVMLNDKAYNVVVSKEYFRKKGQTMEQQASEGFVFKIYSALQAITNNRSRLGRLVKG
jgi:hypothetical protein